jgi:hypothetical protein
MTEENDNTNNLNMLIEKAFSTRINTQTHNFPPLVDVTDSEFGVDLSNEGMFDETERMVMVDTCADLIADYIEQNPLVFSKPEYTSIIRDSVIGLLEETIKPCVGIVAEEELGLIYQLASYIVFTTIAPRRSYKKTFIRKVKQNPEIIKQRLEDIRSRPQSEQCTPQWYIDRWNRLSGSNAWKAFSTQSQINSLIVEKCKPIDTNKFKNVNTESSLHHGKRFEPVSTQYYEYIYGAKVAEFGCVPHNEHTFLGASPDGIVVNEECERFGRMLEIKNVTTRKINGIPKEEYWIQMQLQMEVCNLNECDFLETEINTYADYNEFEADGTFQKSANGKFKGVISQYNVDGQPFYEYAPFQCTQEEFDKWEEQICEKHSNHTWVTNIYYRIDTISCVLVLRNKKWMRAAIEVLRKVWEQILYERENGFDHRLPKTKTTTKKTNYSITQINENMQQTQQKKTNCVFNVVKLLSQDGEQVQEPQQERHAQLQPEKLEMEMDTELKTETDVKPIVNHKKRKTHDKGNEPTLYVDI